MKKIWISLLFLFIWASICLAITTTTCGDGTMSLHSQKFNNSVVDTWNYFNSSNTTRVGALAYILLDKNTTLNITDEGVGPLGVGAFQFITYYNLNNYSFRIWNGSFGVNEILSRDDYDDCLQETANDTHLGDGSCILNYTGNYSFSNNWTDSADTFDGSILTYGIMDTQANATMYINYTKPAGATDFIWVVSDGNITGSPWYVNLTLTSKCWSAYGDKLLFSVVSGNTTENFANWSCYNGSIWTSLRYVVSGNSSRIYEEWGYWDIDGTWTSFFVGGGVYAVRPIGSNINGTILNASYTVNVSSGFDLHSGVDITALCGPGCPSYEENLSTIIYNFNGNWSNKNSWRVYNPYFGGNNWTITWSEYPYVCTTTTTTGESQCNSTKVTIFAGFALLAVLAIVVSAFMIIKMFGDNFDGTALTVTAIAAIGLCVILFIGYYIIGTLAQTTCGII